MLVIIPESSPSRLILDRSCWDTCLAGSSPPATGRSIIGGKDECRCGNRHSDKEKFRSDLNRPKGFEMSERLLKTLRNFPTSKLNTPRPLPQTATISECRYRWLRVRDLNLRRF
jgi:hypothetical protein